MRVRTLAMDLPTPRIIPLHAHSQHQLVYGSSGVMTVRTARGLWVVPAHRAVWMPAEMEHEIETSGFVALRTLYLDPALSASFPSGCEVVSVSPLLRELILHACRIGVLNDANAEQARLIAVLVDQLHVLPSIPFQLPLPVDPRAKRAARAILAAPGDERSFTQLCRHAGGSRRTLDRLFSSETGMTIGLWRQQARVLRALQLLGAGHNVTSVALEVGYSGTSAFVSMFKKAIGTTPGNYSTRSAIQSRGS
jgi:AraC-like DNA-binding protein